MYPTVDQLKKNYEGYDDKTLIRIATEEAAKLRPEALTILKQVIAERGLPTAISESMDTQLKPMDEAAFTTYTDLLPNQPCPICNSTDEKLNATIAATVMSFVLMTRYSKQLKIACPSCLDKQNNSAMLKSAALGWWGLPWGVIRTPQALLLNRKMKKQNHAAGANDLLKAYTHNNIGRVEAGRDDPEKLRQIIIYTN